MKMAPAATVAGTNNHPQQQNNQHQQQQQHRNQEIERIRKNPYSYKFCKILGEGSFSTVYLAIDATQPKPAPTLAATTTIINKTDDKTTISATATTNASFTNAPSSLPPQLQQTPSTTITTTAAAAKNHTLNNNANIEQQQQQQPQANTTTTTNELLLSSKQQTQQSTTLASEQATNNEYNCKIKKYAIKVCDKRLIKRYQKAAAIMREKMILTLLNQHNTPHVIRLYYTFQDATRLFFVMTYAKNGDFLTFMQNKKLSLDEVRNYGIQLLSALEQIHKLGIIHRDLKPENILLDRNNRILLSDFGSAKLQSVDKPLLMSPLLSQAATITGSGASSGGSTLIVTPPPVTSNGSHRESHSNGSTPDGEEEDSSAAAAAAASNKRRMSFVGTAQYVSPEMLKHRIATNMSDIWAYGVILYQMITNIMPFNAPNEYLIYQKINHLDYDFSEDFDADAKHLIESLIKLEPSERLSAQDCYPESGYISIREHSFFATCCSSVTIAPINTSTSTTNKVDNSLLLPPSITSCSQQNTVVDNNNLSTTANLVVVNKDDDNNDDYNSSQSDNNDSNSDEVFLAMYEDVPPGLDDARLLQLLTSA